MWGQEEEKEKSQKFHTDRKMNLKKPVPVLSFKTKIDLKSFIMLGTKITVVRYEIPLQSAVEMSVVPSTSF